MMFGVGLFIISSSFPIILLKYGKFGGKVNIMIIFVWILTSLVYGYFLYFDKRLYFNDKGVKYHSLLKKKFIGWDEVQEVGIVVYSPVAGHATANLLCISTQKGVTGRRIVVFEEHGIYMNYRRSLIPIINKYWKGEIIS
ncbi:hypothetical protein M2105_006605 [Paenibacillus sp. PastF-1]|uniref:hypothetical protein n=1 Tax=Paenibacillus sp. PastH-2 TaxID=2940530 RepID=UPI002473C1DE|nr:hypothetical protein [Paenibacillus sp. PastH-2]MDF9845512.1 hypothetical protein [Paenibacillus sp. PastF-2]MDF9852083.1 hypothetical protein [Paenibacillus sp. PastM-2]MDF9858677.1 hypothetical protein [Paenibacillus sp. PastF-1]MDH6511299.1 hypothetical protein [Paenibacillus sp. PastM-3]MDH6483924.1 hypothetical protein [Paenibacillus sp. PastH-2]